MMNVIIPSSSECSSGCESGWTIYLEHSTKTFSNSFRKRSFDENEKQELQKMAKFEDLVDNNRDGYYLYREQEDEEEEDLSMVSDASSGPPHFDHDIDDEEEDNDDDLCYNNGGRLRKQCMKSYAHESHYYCANNMGDDDFAIDDTASSHVFTSKKIGGIHVQNHENASFERLIGYSSQGYSATHFQMGLNSNKSRRQQDLGRQGFSSN